MNIHAQEEIGQLCLAAQRDSERYSSPDACFQQRAEHKANFHEGCSGRSQSLPAPATFTVWHVLQWDAALLARLGMPKEPQFTLLCQTQLQYAYAFRVDMLRIRLDTLHFNEKGNV